MGRKPHTTKYLERKRGFNSMKVVRDEMKSLREGGMTYREIAREMRRRRDVLHYTTVRRILLRRGLKKPRKLYNPRSIPRFFHPTVKALVDELYADENTRTTKQIIELVKDRMGIEIKKDVIACIREELGLRQYRVRYGHAVRVVNQLLRLVFCEKMIERGEQFLVHTFTDESYVQLGKNAQTCFVKNRADAVKAAPKHVPKLLIWAGISVRGPTPITILRGNDCIVNSLKYQQILHDTFLEATFGPIGKLVQDAAPCHSSKSTKYYLERSEIMVEEWPPESTDITPIETVWAIMKRWVDGEWRPISLDHLEEGIRYWWTNHCTKDLCIRLIERVQTKMRQVKANKGRPCPD